MVIDSSNFIKEMKRKNEKALDYVYESYSRLAYRIALDILKNVGTKEDIEECVSDIFVGIWNNISKYDESITTYKKWFISVSKYKALDYRRRLKCKNNSQELNDDILIDSESTEEKLIREEDISTLKNLIDEMKDIDRQIFIKRYLEGESIESISKSLGYSRAAVDNRLSRGRRSIKNKWIEIMGR